MKRVAIALVSLLVVAAAAWIAGDRWGARRLASYRRAWKAANARRSDEDARRRVPVLRGAIAREENAAPLERDLLARLEAAAQPSLRDALKEMGRASPFAPAGPEVGALEEHRALVEGLARAAECARCDWEHEYDRGYSMPIQNLIMCRTLAQLAVAAGHERARAGDLRGAADRYLDVARFGVDVDGGVLIQAMIAAAIQSTALRSLGALVTDAPSGTSAPLGEIDGALRVLEPSLVDAARTMRGEAAYHGGLAKEIDEGGLRALREMDAAGPALLLPARAVAADALPAIGALDARAVTAAGLPDRAARDAALAEIEADASASRNPLVRATLPNLCYVVEGAVSVRSLLAVVRVAIAVERRRRADGRAPSLEEMDLPLDPSGAPARLRYEVTGGGAGYRIWSVGANGKDDGGALDPGTGKDDIVAERRGP